ncbi:MAG: PDZ domain-containing protein [Planctomycetes bacterium]|nr:PDZ domain-containing protein [Planctomycetota bacterium]
MKKFSALKRIVLAFNILLTAAIFVFTLNFFVFPQKQASTEPLTLTADDGEDDVYSSKPAPSPKHSGMSISYSLPALPITAAAASAKQDAVDISAYISVSGTCVDYTNPANSMAFLNLKKKNNDSLLVRTKEPIELTGISNVFASNIQIDFVEFNVVDKTQKLFIGTDAKPENLAVQATASTPAKTIPGPDKRPGAQPPNPRAGNPPYQGPLETGKVAPPMPVINADNFNTYQDPTDPYLTHVDPKEWEAINKNPEGIAQGLEAYPQNLGPDGDSCDGALIKKVAPGSFLEKRGLKSGDIVKSINGIQIKSVSQKNSLMNDPAIRNAGALTVEVERAGQLITLQYKKQ